MTKLALSSSRFFSDGIKLVMLFYNLHLAYTYTHGKKTYVI
jgi:hypothetical protein